jgi:hypothetical protein
MTRNVVEVTDGQDDELIGYAVAVTTKDGYRLEPEVYGTRSQAVHAQGGPLWPRTGPAWAVSIIAAHVVTTLLLVAL